MNPREYAFHTFDVFDTLLTRVWLKPADALTFCALAGARAGLVKIEADAWCQRRQAAEARLRRQLRDREVTLAEIYSSLAPELGWTAAEAAQAMAIELDCERRSSRPIGPMVRLAQGLVAASHGVGCISDFYAPRSFVCDLLRLAGLPLRDEDIFVSCDERVTKRSGKLFALVACRLNIAPASIRHVGDHPRSDVRQALRAGFGVDPYTRGHAEPQELLLAADAGGPRQRLIASAIGGAARRARLDVEVRGRQEILASVATSVAGPLIFGYVLWLLECARDRGIRRLYFLARDGQILRRVAGEIARSLRLDIDLRYLYASRRAWFLASTALATPQEQVAALTCDGSIIIKDVLERLEIDLEQVSAALVQAGFAATSWVAPIAPSEVQRFRDALLRPPFQALIARRAELEHQLCSEYLRCEGVCDDVPMAIVDVGWKGRMQAALTRLLRPVTTTDLAGFYLALRERPPESQIGPAHTYLDHGDALALNPTLTEVFCAADHGTLLGYKRAGSGQIVPNLAGGSQPLLDWGVPLFQDSVVGFAVKMLDAMRVLNEPTELLLPLLRQSGVRAMRRLVDQPSPEEATVFGAFPHDASQFHTNVSDLAPAVPTGVLLAAIVRPTMLDARSHWQQASIVRSTRWHRLVTAVWRARLDGGSRLKRILKAGTGSQRRQRRR